MIIRLYKVIIGLYKIIIGLYKVITRLYKVTIRLYEVIIGLYKEYAQAALDAGAEDGLRSLWDSGIRLIRLFIRLFI